VLERSRVIERNRVSGSAFDERALVPGRFNDDLDTRRRG
jgi:hypothetical protein